MTTRDDHRATDEHVRQLRDYGSCSVCDPDPVPSGHARQIREVADSVTAEEKLDLDVELSPDQRAAYRRRFSGMPYAGGLAVGGFDGPKSHRDALEWLDALAAVLRDHAKRTDEATAELAQHRRDRDALRRVFGTAAP